MLFHYLNNLLGFKFLGGLLVMVQDTASVEKILNEKNVFQNPVYPTNVQTSGMF